MTGLKPTLAVTSVLALVIGCAPSILPVTPSSATRIQVPPQTQRGDSAAVEESTTVEVRYYSHSPTVTILAWASAETAYGLRAWLRRDGSLIRGHRFYVSTYATATRPAFIRAVMSSHVLEITGTSRDVQWCVGGKPCTPAETFEVLIPDPLLRSIADSVPITFYDRAGRRLSIILHQDLIDGYLGRVDSVVAVIRSKP
jgi:hypothetical protein